MCVEGASLSNWLIEAWTLLVIYAYIDTICFYRRFRRYCKSFIFVYILVHSVSTLSWYWFILFFCFFLSFSLFLFILRLHCTGNLLWYSIYRMLNIAYKNVIEKAIDIKKWIIISYRFSCNDKNDDLIRIIYFEISLQCHFNYNQIA